MKQAWTKPVWLNQNKNIVFGSNNILNLPITWMTELILSNPFAPKRSQRKKIVFLQNAEKQIVPRESTAKGVSFEW